MNNRSRDYSDLSKKRLADNLKKKFQTTTIGSLAAFEEEFGHLWGHGLTQQELTEEQKDFRLKWQAVRTSILDLGNSNLRAAQGEIDQYTLHWNRYITNFGVQ